MNFVCTLHAEEAGRADVLETKRAKDRRMLFFKEELTLALGSRSIWREAKEKVGEI